MAFKKKNLRNTVTVLLSFAHLKYNFQNDK